MTASSDEYRVDIEGMRGLAVAAVILYHFFPSLAPAGYIGVDVFFVISGYVITSYMIRTSWRGPSQFLLEFYSRRIKRLLPVLFVAVWVTAIAFVGIATRPSADVITTGAAALFGLSNVQLYRLQQDYFAIDAQLNPFTQTWSLSVEEQFYLFYAPLFAALHVIFKEKAALSRRLLKLAAILGGGSFLLFAFLSWRSPSAAFYLLPSRIWELSAGVAAFLLRDRVASIRWRPHIAAAGVLGILILPQMELGHFWGSTLSVLAATAGVLFSRTGDVAHEFMALPALRYIGRLSYSLYIWHWSLLVIGKWSLGDSLVPAIVLLAATFAISVVTYNWVENPIRYARMAGQQATIVAAMVLVGVGAFILHAKLGSFASSNNNNLAALFGVVPPESDPAAPCDGSAALKGIPDPLRECLGARRTLEMPKAFYVLGDSHAGQLYPMLQEALRGTGFDLRYVNFGTSREFPRVFIEGGARSDALEFVISDSQPGDVLLVAFHRGRLNDVRDKHLALHRAVQPNAESRAFERGFTPHVRRLSDQGVRLIFVADTPLMGAIATSASCMFQIKLFGQSICRVSRHQDQHTRSRQDEVFRRLAAVSSAAWIWDPLPLIYRNNPFLDVADADGSYVMMDWNHISKSEAVRLAPSFRDFLVGRVLRH